LSGFHFVCSWGKNDDDQLGHGTTDDANAPAMVGQDPGLPFSVANSSRAARITPNYFSMPFRKHAGQAFASILEREAN
jgi:hypothetical protein